MEDLLLQELAATRKEIESLRDLIITMTGKPKAKKARKKTVEDYRKSRAISTLKKQLR